MKLSRLYKLLVWVLVLFTLPSCEEDVTNLRSVDMSPKLVVTSYISPQDTELKVQLQQTQPGVGKSKTMDQLRVTDATVTLSDGVKTVALAYDYATDTYKTNASNLPVNAGKTYFLKVSSRSGYKAEATCTVPSVTGITITEMAHKTTAAEWSPEAKDHQFSYKWSDAPDAENFYRSMAYLVVKQRSTSGFWNTSTQPFYLQENDAVSFIKDERKGGATLKSPNFHTVSYSGMNRPSQEEFELHALLIVSDKNYFMYHQSVANQSVNGDNPFAEPVFVYTNIQGGLGVFGAYNEVKAFVTVR